MTISKGRLLSALLAGTAVAALAAPAHAAADAPAGDRIQQLEQEIQDLSAQVQDLKRQQAAQYADQQQQQAQQTHASIDGGHPTISSGDGNFTATVHALGQLDAADYSQSHRSRALPTANGPDLSSGANFRRVYLGVQGKAFGDWSYNVNLNFGGSGGTESPGTVQSVYIQYDGWKPFAFRIGAYPTPTGLEDATSGQDTLFLERPGATDVVRNLVGGDGRDTASIIYAGDNLYGAVSLSDGKVGDAAVFDEQLATEGRLSYTFQPGPTSRLVVSGSVGDLFRAPDASQIAASIRNISISLAPELTVDSEGTKLISTGSVNTDSFTYWGGELAGNFGPVYAGAGYFGYHIDRRQTALSDFDFHGWYAQASWVFTGESRGWSKNNATYTAPVPDHPLDLSAGGWGAWEAAARYSNVDLNDRAGSIGSPMPVDGIRGGEQKIWTAGLNWYPNSVIRFELQYQHIDIDRISTASVVTGLPGLYPSVGQTVQAVSLRSQVSF